MIHPVGWTQFPEFSKIFYLAGLFAACDSFCFQLENGFSRLCKSGGKNNCCFSVIERLCTALVILQKSTRLEETAITDKADQVLFCFQGYKCTPCPETWLQYGENCYYFSKEWKTWQESKARCSALESRFLKIESKKELDFVMQSAQSYGSYSFWTGLSHNGSEGPWLWEDGSAFSTDLFQIQETSSRPFLECVWLQGSNIGTAQCGEYKFCICEKMVDPAVIEQVNYSDRK
uniref:C-type lectin domain-containing protein n=1 Tax=Cairina moschata TaxID=8855 RepID=A0A8C3B8Z8_CAIMO